MVKNILIVCTGNICRSPMAEALLQSRLKDGGLRVSSAGTSALAGHGADPHAVGVMRSFGIDIEAHRARQLTLPLLTAVDLVLTLDDSHGSWIMRRYPQLRGRVHKLLKWRGDQDVADPYRGPLQEFESAFLDIQGGVDDWLGRIGD